MHDDIWKELTGMALRILMDRLRHFGNRPSRDQEQALAQILVAYAQLAKGGKTGRLAFPLQTGLGKTTSIMAFALASHQLGMNITMAVAASQVEQLCDLKRGLIDIGIPADMIALVHTYKYSKSITQEHFAGEDLPDG